MIWNCVEERVTIERDNGAQYGRMVRKGLKHVLELGKYFCGFKKVIGT